MRAQDDSNNTMASPSVIPMCAEKDLKDADREVIDVDGEQVIILGINGDYRRAFEVLLDYLIDERFDDNQYCKLVVALEHVLSRMPVAVFAERDMQTLMAHALNQICEKKNALNVHDPDYLHKVVMRILVMVTDSPSVSLEPKLPSLILLYRLAQAESVSNPFFWTLLSYAGQSQLSHELLEQMIIVNGQPSKSALSYAIDILDHTLANQGEGFLVMQKTTVAILLHYFMQLPDCTWKTLDEPDLPGRLMALLVKDLDDEGLLNLAKQVIRKVHADVLLKLKPLFERAVRIKQRTEAGEQHLTDLSAEFYAAFVMVLPTGVAAEPVEAPGRALDFHVDLTANVPVRVTVANAEDERQQLIQILGALSKSPKNQLLHLAANELVKSVESSVLTEVIYQEGSKSITGFMILSGLIRHHPTDENIRQIMLNAIGRAPTQAWETVDQPKSDPTVVYFFSELTSNFLNYVCVTTPINGGPKSPLSLLFFKLSEDPNNPILHRVLRVAGGAIGSQILGKMIAFDEANLNKSILSHLIDILNRTFEANNPLEAEFINTVYTLMLHYFQGISDHTWEPVDEPVLARKMIKFLLPCMSDEHFFTLAQLVIQKTSIHDLEEVRLHLVEVDKRKIFDEEKIKALLVLTEDTISKFLEGLATFEGLTMAHQLQKSVCDGFTHFDRYPQNSATQTVVSRLIDAAELSQLTVVVTQGRLKQAKVTPLIVLIKVVERFPEDMAIRNLAVKVIDRLPSETWTTKATLNRHSVTGDIYAVFLLGFLQTTHKDLTKVTPGAPFSVLLYMLAKYPNSQSALAMLKMASEKAPPEALGEMIAYEAKPASGKKGRPETISKAATSHLMDILSRALQDTGSNRVQVIDGVARLFSRYFETLEPHAWEVVTDSSVPKRLIDLLVAHLEHDVLFRFAQTVILKISLQVLPSLHASLQEKRGGPQGTRIKTLISCIERENPEIQKRIQLAAKKEAAAAKKAIAEKAAKEAAAKKAREEKFAKERATKEAAETKARQGIFSEERVAWKSVSREAASDSAYAAVVTDLVKIEQAPTQHADLIKKLLARRDHFPSEFFDRIVENNIELISGLLNALSSYPENQHLENDFIQLVFMMAEKLPQSFWGKRPGGREHNLNLFPLAQLCNLLWRKPDNPVFLSLLQMAMSNAGPAMWCQTWQQDDNIWSPISLLVDKLFWEWDTVNQVLLAPVMQLLSVCTVDTWPPAVLYKGQEIDSPLRLLAILFCDHPDNSDLLNLLVIAKDNAPNSAWLACGVGEYQDSSALSVLEFAFTSQELTDMDQEQVMQLKDFTSMLRRQVSIGVSQNSCKVSWADEDTLPELQSVQPLSNVGDLKC